MAHSIRISDDLYALAQSTSQALARPLAQQLEYWARLGAALDAAGISTGMAMELLGNGVAADKFLAVALGREAGKSAGLRVLKERQRKDAEEVATGKRSPRSLLALKEGDLKKYQFTQNPSSEFSRSGEDW